MSIKYYDLKDGTKLCYKDTGTGRPVIFLHGWGESKKDWDAYEPIISGAGFRFICLDQRAAKDTASSNTHPVTEYLLVDDVAELIESLDLHNVTLVGHSLGVTEVINYCGRYGNDRLQSVVLMDAPPKQCCIEGEGYEFGIWNNTFTTEKGYSDSDWMDRDMHDYLKNWIMDSNPEIRNNADPDKAASDWADNYMAAFHMPDMAELYRSTIAVDERANVPKITVPMAFFYPDPGNICRADLWTWYRDNATCDFTAYGFPSESHFFCIEEEHIPAVTGKLVEFLKTK